MADGRKDEGRRTERRGEGQRGGKTDKEEGKGVEMLRKDWDRKGGRRDREEGNRTEILGLG